MCEMCQLQFRMDHDTKAAGNVPCPMCGDFYVPPGQEWCYHCFAQENLNEKCRRCKRKGAKRRTTRVN